MRKNKKAITAPIVDFWAIVAFILLIILFYFIIRVSVAEGAKPMEDRAESLNAYGFLNSYLRSPVTVDGREMQISQLIIDSHYKKDYSALKQETEKMLDNLRTSVSGWNIDVIFPDNELSVHTYTVAFRKPELQATAILPTQDNDIIKIIVFKESQ